MKVTGVETVVISNIEPHRGGRYWLFVQLTTDEGITGLGERPTGHALNLNSQISLIKDLCEQFVIGNRPLRNRTECGKQFLPPGTTIAIQALI